MKKVRFFIQKFFPFGNQRSFDRREKKVRRGFLFLVIAGTVFAPQMSHAINNPFVDTKTFTSNSVLYLVHIQDPTNSGVYHSYLYSPKIYFGSCLLGVGGLQDVIPAQYVGLLPTVESSDTTAYLKADFDIGAKDASSLDWANISAVAADITIFSGATYSVASADTADYSWSVTDTYVDYVYVDGVLTPITHVITNIDNVQVIEISAIAASQAAIDVETWHAASLRAWVENGVLHVSGLTAGETWSVYNAAGVCIYVGAGLAPAQSSGLAPA